MCLAIPARIRSIDLHAAQAELSGVVRSVSVLLTPEAKVGDYVLVHAGYAISMMDEAEAQETLKLLMEMDGALP